MKGKTIDLLVKHLNNEFETDRYWMDLQGLVSEGW